MMRTIAPTWVFACALAVGCSGLSDRASTPTSADGTSAGSTSAGSTSADATRSESPGTTGAPEPSSFRGESEIKGGVAPDSGTEIAPPPSSQSSPRTPAGRKPDDSAAAKLRSEGYRALNFGDARMERDEKGVSVVIELTALPGADVHIAPRRAEDPVAIELELLGRGGSGTPTAREIRHRIEVTSGAMMLLLYGADGALTQLEIPEAE